MTFECCIMPYYGYGSQGGCLRWQWPNTAAVGQQPMAEPAGSSMYVCWLKKTFLSLSYGSWLILSNIL